MKLRHKFGILVLVYVLSLSINLVMSGWCIVTYFQSAFIDFQSTLVQQAEIERLRAVVRLQARMVESRPFNEQVADEYERLQFELTAGLSGLRNDILDFRNDDWDRIQESARKAGEAARFLLEPEADRGADASVLARDELVQLDRLLGTVRSAIGQRRHSAMERATETQQKVVSILIANSACGALLCLIGLFLVRRWVLRPVSDLRLATQEISDGNFAYRIRPQSGDEIGQLAAEVNHMAATIMAMQKRLIEQERLAAAGEMVARLAHNIRNPLAGIRGLAEATEQIETADEETIGNQRRIINSIDRFERWLRDLQQSVSPLNLKMQMIRIDELVAGVCTALQPMADRRSVRLEMHVDEAAREVQGDGFHLEQALVALITNAIQASRAGQCVRVQVGPAPQRRNHWMMSIQDEGEGIPADLREKIFQPYFTTKPGGNGVGLAMANKVIRTHGGELSVDSHPGQGSRFDVVLPGLMNPGAP